MNGTNRKNVFFFDCHLHHLHIHIRFEATNNINFSFLFVYIIRKLEMNMNSNCPGVCSIPTHPKNSWDIFFRFTLAIVFSMVRVCSKIRYTLDITQIQLCSDSSLIQTMVSTRTLVSTCCQLYTWTISLQVHTYSCLISNSWILSILGPFILLYGSIKQHQNPSPQKVGRHLWTTLFIFNIMRFIPPHQHK